LFNSECKLYSAVDKAAMNLIAALGIPFRIANSHTRWDRIFKELLQDEGQVRSDFSENLRASL
jgi:phage FluMu gp28-like protein